MASEIRVNQIQSRTGVSTISFTETGPIFAGVSTVQGSFTVDEDLNVTGNISGSPSITVTDITASGNVSIAGTLTYEDVTNIDSVGVITARDGIHVTGVGSSVGIGTDNPPWPLSVTGTVSGGTVSGSDAGVFIGVQDFHSVIQMNTALDTHGSVIDMGYGGQDFKGRIYYDNSSDYMSLSTNSGERLRITSDGNIGIGTDNINDKLVVHQGTDDDIIVRVNGADSTTEFAGLGVGPGYASVVAGGSGTTDTDLVFMTANQGVETGRWGINETGILYNMEGGYTFNLRRYQGTMPNLTSNTWSTVANTNTIGDAGLWILTFGRFESGQTGSSQWAVTYVGGPVYLHNVSGNDPEIVSVPLYHHGHAQNDSGASCQLTYYSGSAHTSGRVQFRPNGWNYTGTNAYYKFYKIADL